jgi:thiol peroxidase
MATITFKGEPVQTSGNLPQVGQQAPDFELIGVHFQPFTLEKVKGHRVILNIFPSIDTGICAMSVKRFNEEATKLDNTKVVCISRDLPFAHHRFCGAEGIENVISVSDYATGAFSKDYGVLMTDGLFAHLSARAVVVLDEQGKVLYTELVPEIAQEPDYDAALASL